MPKHVSFLSIPGLRVKDISATATPTLYDWANRGVLAEVTPTFPCVTSCVQATFVTGTPPDKHGVIANGFFDRHRREVEFWIGHNDKIVGEPIWDSLHKKHPGSKSAVWHAQNIKGASADFVVTPSPIHEADGTTKLWCYSKPDGLYQRQLDSLGHFPLQHYWGPLSNIQSTKWILSAAAWLIERERPNLNWIYIPHLDYASQKFGPDSAQAQAALTEMDAALAEFARRVGATANGRDMDFLVVGEYALTTVDQVVYPNRVLREHGLLKVRDEVDGEHIDLVASAGFAMVDHQLAHVFVDSADAKSIERVCGLFSKLAGVAGVYAGDERARVGLDHERSGDVILVSQDSAWFAYYWWLDDKRAPGFARTVDIHRKPGYDPVELFFDPVSKGIPLDARLVKGSHGVPAAGVRHRTALVCSKAMKSIQAKQLYRDSDIKRMTLELFDD